MPKRTPLNWEDLEHELHVAGVSPEEIEAGAREMRESRNCPSSASRRGGGQVVPRCRCG
jgi:hypothetical protein